jgi:hypothetical protein
VHRKAVTPLDEMTETPRGGRGEALQAVDGASGGIIHHAWVSDKICVMRAGPASTIAQVVYETLAGHRAPRYTALADQTRLASAIERKRSVSGAIG